MLSKVEALSELTAKGRDESKGRGGRAVGKFLATMAIVLLAFGGGYLVGGRDQRDVRQGMEQVKNEMGKKTLEMERLLRRTRIRGHLTEARDALTLAQSHLLHQDFGMARQAVGKARESLQAAQKLDGTDGSLAHLRPLDKELERLGGALPALGLNARLELERVKELIHATDEPDGDAT